MAEGSDEPNPEAEVTKESLSKNTDEPIFVLHRIETVDLGNDGRFIVFSAVGYVSGPPHCELAY